MTNQQAAEPAMTEQQYRAADTSAALLNFMKFYNNDLAFFDQTLDKLAAAEARIAELESLCTEKDKANELLFESSKIKDTKIEEQSRTLEVANVLAKKAVAMKEELTTANLNVRKLQEEITASKAGSMQRIKALAERRRESNEKLKKEVKAKNAKINELKRSVSNLERLCDAKDETIVSLERARERSTTMGIYHNGSHHLNVWEQPLTMVRPDGTKFKSRALLYMHQSGRGGLVVYDPETQTSQMCKAPAGGLRMSKECAEAAENWMFKVNELQNGELEDLDLLPVNFNADSLLYAQSSKEVAA